MSYRPTRAGSPPPAAVSGPAGLNALRKRRSPEDMDIFQDFVRHKFVFLRRYRNGLSVTATGCLVVSLLLSMLQVGSRLLGAGEQAAWVAERVLPWTLTLFGLVCAWWCIFPPLDPSAYVTRLNEGMRFLNVYFDDRRLCIARLHQQNCTLGSPRSPGHSPGYSPCFTASQPPPSPGAHPQQAPALNLNLQALPQGGPADLWGPAIQPRSQTPEQGCATPPTYPTRTPVDLPFGSSSNDGVARRWPNTPPPSPTARTIPAAQGAYQTHLTQRTRMATVTSAGVREAFAATSLYTAGGSGMRE